MLYSNSVIKCSRASEVCCQTQIPRTPSYHKISYLKSSLPKWRALFTASLSKCYGRALPTCLCWPLMASSSDARLDSSNAWTRFKNSCARNKNQGEETQPCTKVYRAEIFSVMQQQCRVFGSYKRLQTCVQQILA